MRSLQWYKRGAAYVLTSLETEAGHHWWPKDYLTNGNLSKKYWSWRVGEEWWRVAQALHPHKFLRYKHLCYFCEEWRVFLKEAYYYPAFECHIWWLPASYMMNAYVIYDTCLRHIWYLPASYMIPVCVIYDAGSCHIGCRLMPNMPPASTLYADIRKHLSWRCYTLGEWVIFMLPSWRETATISANGGCWSYTLSERLNAKYLIIR